MWLLVISVSIASLCHAQTLRSSQPSQLRDNPPTLLSSQKTDQRVSLVTITQAHPSKKKLKHKNSISRVIAARLKAIKAIVWGQNGWHQEYFRRLVTCTLSILTGSLAKDLVHANTQHKKYLSESISTNNELIQEENEKKKGVIGQAQRVKDACEKNNERQRLLKQIVTNYDTQCVERLEAYRKIALENQLKRAQSKAYLDSLSTLFMQAIIQNRPIDAIQLLTEEDPAYIEVSTRFVRAVCQSFNARHYDQLASVNNGYAYIEGVMTNVTNAIRSQSNDTLKLFRIAAKLNNTEMANSCLLSRNNDIKEKQKLMFREAFKYERPKIVWLLREKFPSMYYDMENMVTHGGRNTASYKALLDIEGRNCSFRSNLTCGYWDDAVAANDYEIMQLILSKVKSIDLQKTSYPIFKYDNLYAMDLLLKKMNELGENVNKEDELKHTLLNDYLAYCCYKNTGAICPLMTKLLINAGVQFKDTRMVEPLIAGNLIKIEPKQGTSLECITSFARGHGDIELTAKANQVAQLLLTERDKVNISDIAALCSASVLGFGDQVHDIIFSAQQSIHPRWLTAVYALSNLNVGKAIQSAHGERTDAWQIQGHKLPEAGPIEDNNILLTLFAIDPGTMRIIQEYVGSELK